MIAFFQAFAKLFTLVKWREKYITVDPESYDFINRRDYYIKRKQLINSIYGVVSNGDDK